jgi:hypothetical protein
MNCGHWDCFLDEKRSSKLLLWSVVLDNDYMIKNQLDEYMWKCGLITWLNERVLKLSNDRVLKILLFILSLVCIVIVANYENVTGL